MMLSLVSQLRGADCVASLHLGEPQRALLDYFGGIDTVRLELEPDVSCSALLVQGSRDSQPTAPATGWTLVWEGARPGDGRELYRLYRRDIPPDRIVARFPE